MSYAYARMAKRLTRSAAARVFPGSIPGPRFIMSELKKGIYRHYKGKLYRVLGVGRHSETLEELVFYQALYESEFGKDSLWVRPLAMFTEDVEIDGKNMPRFMFVKEA